MLPTLRDLVHEGSDTEDLECEREGDDECDAEEDEPGQFLLRSYMELREPSRFIFRVSDEAPNHINPGTLWDGKPTPLPIFCEGVITSGFAYKPDHAE